MSSTIAKILALSPEEEQSVSKSAGKLQSLTEWLTETIEALKDNPLLSSIGKVGEGAKEWSGTLKALSAIVESATREQSAETIGWIACNLAYRQAAERAIRELGRPASRLPFATEIVHERLKRLKLDDPIIIRGFSLRSVAGHPFVRMADQGLITLLELAGYVSSETRHVLRAVRSSFVEELSSLLTGEKREKFAPFFQWMQLDTDDSRLYSSLSSLAELERIDLEEKPALRVEPFAIDDVYIKPECVDLRWEQMSETDPETPRLDVFDEACAPRQDMMSVALRLINDSDYNDWIVLMGPPGAGKSTFTKKLCVRLGEEGFLPIRIPLQHLRVDLDLFDAVRDFVLRFGGVNASDFKTDLFREKVYSESCPINGGTVSPYIFIFDGWDEINLAADEGFQRRVNRLLESIRRDLSDQTRNKIRVIIAGRPSAAIARSGFLRKGTHVLTIRTISPELLKTYLIRLDKALGSPRFSGTQIDHWTLGPIQRYEEILSRYSEEFPETKTLEVLGQPLLAHLGMRVMASFEGDLKRLVASSTTLYRHLTDLTCKRGGKAPSEDEAQKHSARLEGKKLRELLHGVAISITNYGSESIPEDELKIRLESLEFGDPTIIEIDEAPLARLMISFYFKQVSEHSGCEFLHKSFREYLTAEGIVEILKGYPERCSNTPFEKPIDDYWKDFRVDDPRYWLTRKLCEILCAQWLSSEIQRHIIQLLKWEIERSANPEPDRSTSLFGDISSTRPLPKRDWENIRDSLADLWDWWGEGVHLRPQPELKNNVWNLDKPPYAVELTRLATRRVNYNTRTPPQAVRMATVDAHLGNALFQICAALHFLIAKSEGWNDAVEERGPRDLWAKSSLGPRRYQATVNHLRKQFVQFAPSGQSALYFRYYVDRIAGAGLGRFPSGSFMAGIYLGRSDLRGKNFKYAFMASCCLDSAYSAHTDFAGAHLTKASLFDTNLFGACLFRTDLDGSDLTQANLYLTDFRIAPGNIKGLTTEELNKSADSTLPQELLPDAIRPSHWGRSGRDWHDGTIASDGQAEPSRQTEDTNDDQISQV